MKNLILSAAAVGFGAIMMPATVAQAECGEVLVGSANWSTAQIVASMDAFILEHGYGCTVSVTPTSTTQTLAMAGGTAVPLVVSEFWANGVDQQVLNDMLSSNVINIDARPFPEAGEFWYVSPQFAADYPELDTVEKVLQRPDLFPSKTVPGAGAFYGCPVGIGWGCEHSNTNLFEGFDMESLGWTLENPASGEGMSSVITDAYLTGGYWFGYYWTPTAVAIKNELVALSYETPFIGGDMWAKCYVPPEPAADCELVPTAYTPSTVVTLVTPSIEDTGAAANYIRTRVMPMADLGSADAYMAENSASGTDTAKNFLKNSDVWEAWVTAEAAEAVRAAL